MERYSEQCHYFIDKDCSKFDPATKNLTKFLKKAWSLFSGIWDSLKCIIGVIKIVPELNKVYTTIKWFIGKEALAAVANLFGHYITAGLWGGIKAAYYFVKIGMQIKDFIKDWKTKTKQLIQGLMFRFGGIIGYAIKIVKSAIAGGRRFRKLKK